jgi:two-component system CheB/CheR fusion protein
MSQPDFPPGLRLLLEHLQRTRGFDFTAYKTTTLTRRIQKRMQMVGVVDYPDYTDYLEVHPEEYARLFDTILINVTAFFRDPPAWEYLATEVLPRVVEPENGGIRVWSAGCSSGQEPYTLAMLLAERLGLETFRRRVKIYATDVDEGALNEARQAAYSPKAVEDVPPALLEKYFERAGERYVFNKDLRRFVIFGRHDLIQDAPISRVGLLTCRNTLMYFHSEAQRAILNRFHFALTDGGVLFLGKSEMLLTHARLFTPLELKWRVFGKAGNGRPMRDQPPSVSQAAAPEPAPVGAPLLRDVVFDADPTAQIVVDGQGGVALINERARVLFGLSARDVGRPLRDLELSYRPADLRSAIDQASADRRTLTLKEVEWPAAGGESRLLDIQVLPLLEPGRTVAGVRIAFSDVTRYRRLQDDLSRSRQELETAYEELQSTNEELETTNEEIQSTNEELETTNEELQSTNEELETMNEELQSTNEELETVNTELRERSDELNRLNAFLESILTNLRSAVVVLDRELRVTVWSDKAEDLWGLRAAEVQGHHFLNLDIGLPVDELRTPIRAALAGESQQVVVLHARNRRGREIECAVSCTPLAAKDAAVLGVILLTDVR